MLIINNLCRPGLKPVTLSIGQGEWLVLTGPSGAGKSLLLRAIADLDPNQGELILNGVNRDAIAAPLWRRQVGYLPADTGWWAAVVQDHFIDPHQAGLTIAKLNMPPECLSWPVERLSTGEKQRLGLARLLERRPMVMLLDEPTSALDAASVAAAETIIRHHCDQGAAIIMTTHDGAQAERLGARRLHIENGQLSEIGP